MKKDRAFCITKNLTHHQALAFSMDERRKLPFSKNSNDRLFHHLRFLRWTVIFARWFPLNRQFGCTCSLLLPPSPLLLNISPSLSVLHF